MTYREQLLISGYLNWGTHWTCWT